jgi:hypothetical protein
VGETIQGFRGEMSKHDGSDAIFAGGGAGIEKGDFALEFVRVRTLSRGKMRVRGTEKCSDATGYRPGVVERPHMCSEVMG